MEVGVTLAILLAFSFIAFRLQRKRNMLLLEDEDESGIETLSKDKKTGEVRPVIPYPYSPASSRIVFLRPEEIEWWDNLAGWKRKEIYDDIQSKIKSGQLELVKDSDGNIIGIKGGE